MRRILIADAGSTKSDWALADYGGKELCRFTTEGINALTAEKDDLESLATVVKSQLAVSGVPDEIYYYGSGCATESICEKVGKSFGSIFPACKIHVYTDLLGAARSLLGHSRGIACILGTGSNSCRYDGEKIVDNIPSLGFILGDEGSGASLGKRLLSDAFKGKLPQPIKESLLKKYNLSLGEILDNIYRNPRPGKFLASFVPFISSHLWNPYIYAMVRREFDTFLDRNVSSYKDSRQVPICFTGSIAFHFSDILKEAASDEGYKVGKIISKPIDGLIEYHTKAY